MKRHYGRNARLSSERSDHTTDVVQSICAKVTALLKTGTHDSAFEEAGSLILDLLFFANSKPVHRQILSWLRTLPQTQFTLLSTILIGKVSDAVTAEASRAAEMQPIALAEPMLSLLEFKPLQMPLR